MFMLYLGISQFCDERAEDELATMTLINKERISSVAKGHMRAF